MLKTPSKIAHRMRNAMQGIDPLVRSARDLCKNPDEAKLERMKSCCELAEASVKALMEQIELLEKLTQEDTLD